MTVDLPEYTDNIRVRWTKDDTLHFYTYERSKRDNTAYKDHYSDPTRYTRLHSNETQQQIVVHNVTARDAGTYVVSAAVDTPPATDSDFLFDDKHLIFHSNQQSLTVNSK